MEGRQRYARRGRAGWQELITGWKRSGLSQQAFCRREGLTLSTFQRWYRILRNEVDDTGSRALSPSPLIPVRLMGEPANPAPGISIWLDERLRIEVATGFDRQTLSRVLDTLGVLR